MKGSNFVPTSKVMIELFHQLGKHINIGILVKKLQIVIFTLLTDSLEVDLLNIFLNHIAKILLTQDGEAAQLIYLHS